MFRQYFLILLNLRLFRYLCFPVTIDGDGSGLTDIPASGIVGLNLSQIASGSATASISPNNGLQINTDTTITGSLTASGSLNIQGSSSYTGGSITLDNTTVPSLPGSDTKVSIGVGGSGAPQDRDWETWY